MFQAAVDRLVNRHKMHEEALVREPVIAHGIWLRGVGRFMLVMVCIFAVSMAIGPMAWWQMLASMLLGSASALGALYWLGRAHSYRNGWINGRLAMMNALREALDRGMSMDHWIAGEIERDLTVLGVTPDEQDDPQD